MTTNIDSHKGTENYCVIELTKENTYVVEVCPIIDEYRVGYPMRKMTYPINEKKKAIATYKRYVKKYCQ